MTCLLLTWREAETK